MKPINFTQDGRVKGGYKQLENVYECPRCGECGNGNGMKHHIKKCDGTGFKNYWSRVKSKQIKALLASIASTL